MNPRCLVGLHNWKENCEQCSRCGKERENIHSWDGCKCTQCGLTRNTKHQWQSDNICAKCKRTKDEAIHSDCLDAVIAAATEILVTDLGDVAGSVARMLHGTDSEEYREHEVLMNEKKKAIPEKHYKKVKDEWGISEEALISKINSILEGDTVSEMIEGNQEIEEHLKISANSTSQDQFVMEVYDFRTEDEKKLIEQAYAGTINDEDLVDKLLVIDQGSYMLNYSALEGICGVDCTYPNPRLKKGSAKDSCYFELTTFSF
jgi:hypothetical protein